MYHWRPNSDHKAAFAQERAVVQHKKKARQGTVGPCTSAADEVYVVALGALEFFDGRAWSPAPERSLGWFPRRKIYGIRPAPGFSGPVCVVSILFIASPGLAPGMPPRAVRLTAPWWRRFVELEASADFDERGQRVLPRADLETLLEQLGRTLAPGAAKRSRPRSVSKDAPSRPDTEAGWLETWARAEDAIRERAGGGLSVDELAAAVNVSPTQLRRIFHAARGLSPKAALTAWRIDAAKRLLRDGRLNVSQVAEKVGYGNLPRFSAAFKATVGVSPSAYAVNGT
ncbi:MAG: helix-turn-helix transcriptional regulator [Planctomycetes bacterium]|nr:helix-turn-helix transcriptional regulator [Planctomycetota bacterium]